METRTTDPIAPTYGTSSPTAAAPRPRTAAVDAIDAFAAHGARQPLVPYRFAPKALGALDVELAVTHCGICHSDLHLVNDDWGISSYPLVPGHEVVGEITRVGSGVPAERMGQRVGVGWLAGACFACEQCLSGNENLCAQWQPTCVGREGGYATHLRVDSRLAFPIPDGLSSAEAAPLLCGGATVFAPLVRHGVGAATRLGVIGVGGLGHLALQYGRAMGAHVTAFSTSSDKEADARRFGADDFVATGAEGALAARAGTCDFILSTVSEDIPWADYVNVLRPNGRLCVVGVPLREIRLQGFPLIAGQKGVVGSAIGSGADIRAMLAFSERHRIVPTIELAPMREVNAALDRLARNQVRYRAVLANDAAS